MMAERLWFWIAWLLPRQLVKWCAIRLMSEATTGRHSRQCVPQLTCLEALQRWDPPA